MKRKPFMNTSTRALPAAIAATTLTLLWFVIAIWCARTWSPTTDEPVHLAGGLTILEYGDFRINPPHPPLVKVLCALPVYLLDRPVFHDEDGPFSEFLTEHWVNTNPPVYGLLLPGNAGAYDPGHLFPARLVAILIGFSAAIPVFLLARDFSSPRGGFIAAALLLFYPEYLGHSALVTYDVPLAAACAWIAWSSWRWWRRPRTDNLVIFVAVCCLASQVKLPAVFFIGYVLLTMLFAGIATRFRRIKVSQFVLLFSVFAVALYATTWVAAGFRFRAIAPDTLQPAFVPYLATGSNDGGLFARLSNVLHGAGVLPETALALLVHLDASGGREFFLSGEWRRTGWYHYFPVTFLLKTPVTMILLTAFLLIKGVMRVPQLLQKTRFSSRRLWKMERHLFVLVPFLMIVFSAMASRFNLGHRYVLFAYVPIAIFGGVFLEHMIRRSAGAARIVLLGFVLFFAEGLAGAPHFATWFNVVAGSPMRYSRVLADSNVDWGQQTGEMLAEAREHGAPFNYAPWVLTPPQFFGVGEDRYRFILGPDLMPPLTTKSLPPDPLLPTFAGVCRVPEIRSLYPGLYDREPDVVRHGYVIFHPMP